MLLFVNHFCQIFTWSLVLPVLCGLGKSRLIFGSASSVHSAIRDQITFV